MLTVDAGSHTETLPRGVFSDKVIRIIGFVLDKRPAADVDG